MSIITTVLRPPALARDIALLLARVLLGGVLIAHGWQKVAGGMDGVIRGFAGMGIPMPAAAAWFTALVELGGGALLLVGLATPIAGLLVSATMLGAWFFVHSGKGILAAQGGWELVGLIGALALGLAGVGAGRLSLDAVLPWGRRDETSAAAPQPATAAA